MNDNYCDCLDASDETRTSACPNGTFVCRNEKYRARKIPSSWVNDGHCDCCDGSDESGDLCQDRCADLYKRDMADATKRADAIRRGVAKREAYVKEAKANIEKDRGDLASLKQKLKDIEVEVRRTERHVEMLKGMKDLEDDIRKDTVPDAHAEKEENTEEMREDLHNEDDYDYDKIEDEDYNMPDEDDEDDEDDVDDEEYQVEEPKHEVEEAEREANVNKADLGEENEGPDVETDFETKAGGERPPETNEIPKTSTSPDAEPPFDDTADKPSVSAEPISSPETTSINPDVVCASLAASSASNAITRRLSFMRHYIHSKLSSIMPFIPAPQGSASSDLSDCISRADTHKWNLSSQKSDLQSKIDELEKKAKINYGPDQALRKLHGNCVKTTVTQYEFEHCAFDLVRQYEHGNSIAVLGRFEGFDGEGHNILKYGSGDRCWNGPARSIKVELLCGEREEIVSVDEPNRCSYHMKFRTPGICSKQMADRIMTEVQRDGKDEL